MRLIFDLETDGLEATKVHCMVTKDLDTGEAQKYPPEHLGIGVLRLQQAHVLVGHNILGYDIPVLQRLYGFKSSAVLLDTMVLSRLYLPDALLKEKDFSFSKKHPDFPREQIGSHSLAAWGRRLGALKDVKPLDFSVYNQEMLDYCAQDVEVTAALFAFIQKKALPLSAIALEHAFAQVCEDIEEQGFWYDINAADQLAQTLVRRRTELVEAAKQTFGGWEVPYLTAKKKLPRTKWVPFNPTSRQHIAKVLQEKYGWEPRAWTDGGQPKIDETILQALPYPEAPLFSELFLVQKRLGYLCEGPHSLLAYYRSGDQRIHGRIIHNGAVTSRCAHVSPNLAQVPRVGKPYGREFRSLFGAPPGGMLVGCDAKGLELRCLAHYMAQYDDGAYTKTLLEGDIHSENQKAAGLPTRDDAKTFIYAFLYGAGDEKLGSIVGGGVREGKRLRGRFLKKLPALRRVQEEAKGLAQSQGWLPGLDGRRLHVRSDHAALNVWLQGAGAVAMKQAAVAARQAGAALVAHVHDEMEAEVMNAKEAPEVGKALAESIRKAGESFSLRCPLEGAFKIGRTWYDTH